MTWVANLAILSGVGHWSINRRSISHSLSCFRIIRGILEDTGRSPLAEKHTRIAFTFEVRILETKLSMSWWRVTISSRTRGEHPPGSADTGFLTALEETRCGPHWCELSSVFMSATWVSSVRCHHLRVSAFTRVTTNGKVLFERACLLNQFAENTASWC